MAARYCVSVSLCPASSAPANSSMALVVSSAICCEFISWFLLGRFLLFALLGGAVRRQEEQMPFLAAGWRSAACAVKAAGWAFIGAKRRALTGEARGLSAAFSQEGQRRDQGWLPGGLELAVNPVRVRGGKEDYLDRNVRPSNAVNREASS